MMRLLVLALILSGEVAGADRLRGVPWSAVGLGLTIAALLWYTATRRSR